MVCDKAGARRFGIAINTVISSIITFLAMILGDYYGR